MIVSQYCIYDFDYLLFYVEASTPKYALVKFNNDGSGCLSVVPVSNIVTENQATVTEGAEYQVKWSKKEM